MPFPRSGSATYPPQGALSWAYTAGALLVDLSRGENDQMLITPRILGFEGSFDAETGHLVCVSSPKYSEVLLCLQDRANIPIARIKLHSEDRYIEAKAVFEHAEALGQEIARRWNAGPVQRPDAAQAIHECAEILGLPANIAPEDVVATLRTKLVSLGPA